MVGLWSTVDAILSAAYGTDYAERAAKKVRETTDLLVNVSKNAINTYSTSQSSTGQISASQNTQKIKKALDAFDE